MFVGVSACRLSNDVVNPGELDLAGTGEVGVDANMFFAEGADAENGDFDWRAGGRGWLRCHVRGIVALFRWN